MKKELEKKQVRICGLRQNCFAIEGKPVSSSVHAPKITHYISLEKKNLDNGFVQELEKVDYPITSESVSSYIDTADYRRDPMQAIASAPKRVNLGDITEVQDFIASNPQEAVRVYRAVGEKLQEYYANKEKAPAEQGGAVEQGGAANEQ